MIKRQVAAALMVASLCGAPVAMAQTTGGNNGAANGARGVRTTGNGEANNGTMNNGGANNGGANNGVASQRTTNERANGQGAILTISPSAVREIQQALNRLGYAAGPVNGVWDRAAADAMIHFQQAHGLEPTGDVNLSAITALGLWDNIIGNPLGTGHKAITSVKATGAPPPRGGKNAANIGGNPLPSQRITNETSNGGQTTGNSARGATGAGNSANRH